MAVEAEEYELAVLRASEAATVDAARRLTAAVSACRAKSFEPDLAAVRSPHVDRGVRSRGVLDFIESVALPTSKYLAQLTEQSEYAAQRDEWVALVELRRETIVAGIRTGLLHVGSYCDATVSLLPGAEGVEFDALVAGLGAIRARMVAVLEAVELTELRKREAVFASALAEANEHQAADRDLLANLTGRLSALPTSV